MSIFERVQKLRQAMLKELSGVEPHISSNRADYLFMTISFFIIAFGGAYLSRFLADSALNVMFVFTFSILQLTIMAYSSDIIEKQ